MGSQQQAGQEDAFIFISDGENKFLHQHSLWHFPAAGDSAPLIAFLAEFQCQPHKSVTGEAANDFLPHKKERVPRHVTKTVTPLPRKMIGIFCRRNLGEESSHIT